MTSTTNSAYLCWKGIRDRCRNPNHPSWDRYGGRGIKVCDRWVESFDNFLSDMGPRPTLGHTVDRENNDGDYEPNNCRWATRRQQANNRSDNRHLILDGEKLTVTQAAEKIGINSETLRSRLRRRYNDNEALRGLIVGQKFDHDGLSLTLHEWSRRTGIKTATLRYRIKNGMVFSDAVTQASRNEPRCFDGICMSLNEWAAKYGVPRGTLSARLMEGWEFEDALKTPVATKLHQQ